MGECPETERIGESSNTPDNQSKTTSIGYKENFFNKMPLKCGF